MIYNALAVYGIKHSEIPLGGIKKHQQDVQQVLETPIGDATLGATGEYYETKQVDVEVASKAVAKWAVPESKRKSRRYPNCRMRSKDNEQYEEKIDEWLQNIDLINREKIPEIHRYATYFIKKQVKAQHHQAQPGPSAKADAARPVAIRIHFSAVRSKRDSGPLGKGGWGGKKPKNQLGGIYCGNSRIEELDISQGYEGTCGIEQYLVGVCFFDDEANPALDPTLLRGVFNFDLDRVFSHYGKGEANDVENVRDNVKAHCNNLVEYNGKSRGAMGNPHQRVNARKLWMVMKGARYASYGMLIWYEHPHDEDAGPNCFKGWKWGSSTDLIEKSDAEFFQFYRDTSKYGRWYFCKAPGAMSVVKTYSNTF